MVKAAKIPVTERAMIVRLRRRLEARGESLRTGGGLNYIYSKAGLVETCADLVAYARKLGVLHPWEEIVGTGRPEPVLRDPEDVRRMRSLAGQLGKIPPKERGGDHAKNIVRNMRKVRAKAIKK